MGNHSPSSWPRIPWWSWRLKASDVYIQLGDMSTYCTRNKTRIQLSLTSDNNYIPETEIFQERDSVSRHLASTATASQIAPKLRTTSVYLGSHIL